MTEETRPETTTVVEAVKVSFLEKVLLHTFSHWPRLRTLLDLDKDGDVDLDDIFMLYAEAKHVVLNATAMIEGFLAMTPGQMNDAIIAVLTKKFPKVQPTVWMFFIQIAYMASKLLKK